MGKYGLLGALLLTLLLLPAIFCRAERLDEEQARYAAAEFFSPSAQSSRLRAKGRQLVLRSEGHERGYYVFDRPEGGTVFVADDDAIGRTVLGYTEGGSFDKDRLPVGLQDWLEQVGVLMDAVHEGKINRSDVRRKAGQTVVSALLRTFWNQGWPYNLLCPQVDGKRCLTGCVATAMAQLMKYWEWPEHGYGEISYTDEGSGQELSANLSLSTYRWKDMLSSYPNDGFEYQESKLWSVATLMRDCGYAVRMNYTPTSSGANVSERTMQTYFHYSMSAAKRPAFDYPEEIWHQFIQADLQAGRPVLYSGVGEQGAHEFILDGYDTEGFYHVNWGWGGQQNGYFMLTNLGGYNFNQWMISHLMPDPIEDRPFSYTLSEDGTLTISGAGAVPAEYQLSTAPWREECQKIRRIVFTKGITSIPYGFGYSNIPSLRFLNLEEIVLPEGLVHIGGDAFPQADKLSSVTIPSTVTSMSDAFAGCHNIRTLHLPGSLDEYWDYLPGLAELTIDEANPVLCVKDNVLYDKSGKYLLFAPAGADRIFVSETTEEVLDNNIFTYGKPIVFKGMTPPAQPKISPNTHGCLYIPYGSTGYEEWEKTLPAGWRIMTYNPDRIPEVKINWTLSDGTLTLSGWGIQKPETFGGENAPYYPRQEEVRKLVVGEDITELCEKAFSVYRNMTEAELPSSMAYISQYCFANAALTTITCHAKKAPELGLQPFDGMPENGTLRVPKGSNYVTWLTALPKGWNIQFFDPEPLATYSLHTGESTQIFEMEEWEETFSSFPNALCIINPRYKERAYLVPNILIEDATAEGGYRCPDFRLTDLSYDYATSRKAPWTGFAPPVSFTVTKGEYKRRFIEGYNSACLPFDISEDMLPRNCRMYVFGHYDTEKGETVFDPISSAKAGQPFFIKCSRDKTEWKVDLAGTTFTTEPPSADNRNMRGTFVSTDAYQGIGYSPRAGDYVFAPLERYLHPFRACFIIDVPSAPAEVRICLSDQADGIRSPGQNANGKDAIIYNLAGQRISKMQKGVNIIDGKKTVR